VATLNAVYKAVIDANQRNQTLEKQKMREIRKCKAVFSSLQQQKRLKLEELK